MIFLLFLLFSSCLFSEINWSFPAQTLSEAGENAENGEVVMNSSGYVVCVFLKSDGLKNRVQEAHSQDFGSTWTLPGETYLSDAGQHATFTRVAIDSTNHVICTWVRSDGSNNRVQEAHSSDGGVSWTTPGSTYLTDASLSANAQNLSFNDSGQAICVWYVNTSIIQEAHSQDFGATWTTPGVTAISGILSFLPSVSINNSGQAICAWNNIGITAIREVHSSDGGSSWSSPASLTTSAEMTFPSPGVVINNLNRAVCVWISNDGSKNRVQEAHSSDGGVNWSSPGASYLSASGQDASYLQVVMNNSNQAICVWRRSDGSNTRIQEAHSSDGGSSWTLPGDTCLSESGQNAITQDVVINDTGQAICAWSRSDGSKNRTQEANSSDGGVSWTLPGDTYLSESGQDASTPKIALYDFENAVITWMRNDGSNNRVQSLNVDSSVFSVSSEQTVLDFFLTKEIYKKVTWTQKNPAVRYNIYSDAALQNRIASIDASSLREYTIHRAKKGEVYYITWENSQGVQNDSTRIVID